MQCVESRSPLRYQHIARIGRGGMAEVVLSVMRSNGVVKLAVLKYLWPELAEDPELAELFLDEARLCARLSHPNLVQTFEVLQHQGRLAMAMEYLDGQPLTRVLNRVGSALTLAARLRIVTNALAALDYAHELRDFDQKPLGLIHRDVSPHNVFVTYGGHVKLLDFGVAKTLVDQHHTRPGGFRGKIAYLAPESFRGGAIDRRADIFSAGVMLWEILVGRRFWKGASESTIAWNLATGAPPRELPPELDVPDALRAVCLRALEPDPDARYQTAAALAADLARFDGEPDDAHARHLGQLVSAAFGRERAERQALIEFHLRGGPADAGGGGVLEYESFELLDESYQLDESCEIVSEEVAPAPRQPPPPPPVPARRSRRGARTFVTAAGAAAIALVAGSYLGSQGVSWPDVSPWLARTASAVRATQPRLAQVEAAMVEADKPADPALPPVVEQIAFRPEGVVRTRSAKRAHRASRHRPLDLTSDEVLGLDGEPLADGPTRDAQEREEEREEAQWAPKINGRVVIVR